jgi:predicted TIM-barrel fold metal-dependent hydrolase
VITRRHFVVGGSAAAAFPGILKPALAKEVPVAIDCHAHVFTRALPMVGDRRYAPDYDADIATYLAMLDANGSTHGVLIQPSFLGTDNSYLLEALARAPDRLRGVAVLSPETSLDQLTAMAAKGIVGVRLNLIGKEDPPLAEPLWRRHLADLAGLGWQVEVQVEAHRLPTLLPVLLDAGPVVVLDHFGKPSPDLGVTDPGFQTLLAAGRTGRVWVKVSAPYRNGPNGLAIAAAAIPLLKDHLGLDHLVWGSDWPHTQFESSTSPQQCRRYLDDWFPDAAERAIVLGRTPAQLFKVLL